MWSFAKSHKQEYSFKEFHDLVSKKDFGEVAIKESRKDVTKALRDDIEIPYFYKEVAEL